MGNKNDYSRQEEVHSPVSVLPNPPEFYLNQTIIKESNLSTKDIISQYLNDLKQIQPNYIKFNEEKRDNELMVQQPQKELSLNKSNTKINGNNNTEETSNTNENNNNDHHCMNIIDDISIENGNLLKTTAGSLLKDIREVYKFKDILGEGHFGTVRLCFRRNETPKRYYAIKSISKKNLSKKDLEDLIREVDIISGLDHPNIIKFHETYHDQYYFHIVMEYCKGKEVFNKIVEDGLIIEKKVAMVIIKVLHAISYCHSRGVTHRDLKPENILFDSNNQDSEIKLIDFGLSRKYNNNEKMHTILGTPYYIAPEVLQGDYTEKCDVWSIGALSYIMLCGDPPFKGVSNSEIFNKILREAIKFDERKWRSISKEAQSFIQYCMNKNPDKRPGPKEALNHLWFTFILQELHSNMFLSMRILNNLKTFDYYQRFKRMILRYIVNMRTKKEIKKYKAAFYAMDFNHMGSIGLDDLEKAFQIANVDISIDEITKLLLVSDNPSKKRIDYTEFLIISINKKKYLTKENLLSAFKYFDVNDSGMIESSDLKDALLRFGKRVVHSEDIDKIILEVIKSHHNTILLEEFMELFDMNNNRIPDAPQ